MSTSSAPREHDGASMSAVIVALRQRYGIEVPPYQVKVLRPLVERLGGSSGLAGGADRLLARDLAAWNAVVETITVPETYFFRHYAHFQILAALVTERFRAARPFHVLSAGCSSGEEVWSIAAVLDAAARGNAGRGSVVGWDVHGPRLADAGAGRYRDWSVRSGLHDYPTALTRVEDHWKVGRHLESWARFAIVNLVETLPAVSPPFDAIFFRNVAIYWKPSVARAVVERLAESLADDGTFFVGPCDPVSLPADRWEHVITNGVRLYRRKRASVDSVRRPIAIPAPRGRTFAPVPTAPAPSTPRCVTPSSATRPSVAPALSTDPNTPTPLDAVKAHADRGEYAVALRVLEKSQLTSVDACMWEGVLRLNLEEATSAVRCFRRCVYLDPERIVFRRWLAVAFEAAGMHDEAERERRNVLEPRMR